MPPTEPPCELSFSTRIFRTSISDTCLHRLHQIVLRHCFPLQRLHDRLVEGSSGHQMVDDHCLFLSLSIQPSVGLLIQFQRTPPPPERVPPLPAADPPACPPRRRVRRPPEGGCCLPRLVLVDPAVGWPARGVAADAAARAEAGWDPRPANSARVRRRQGAPGEG